MKDDLHNKGEALGFIPSTQIKRAKKKNKTLGSLAAVTALIEIQTAYKYERFRNLHICLDSHLNHCPLPGHKPGTVGHAASAPHAGKRWGQGDAEAVRLW